MKSHFKQLKVRRWTVSAIECFKRGCICNGCYYDDFFKTSYHKCKMKGSVIELVRVFGIPDDVKTKTIIEEK